MPYAESTKVTVERSEGELKTILRKYGADRIATGYDDGKGIAVVNFAIAGRLVRLQVTIPSADSLYLSATDNPPHGWKSWTAAKRTAFLTKERAQIERQRWRALVLVTKAKLELVEQGVSSLEREFLADLVLPGGETVHQMLEEKIERAYKTGKLPPMLPGM